MLFRSNLLPNYSVFDEERYFTPGDDARDAATIYRIGGALVGVTICEDIWSPVGPVSAQARAGASLAVSINASPFHRGRLDERTAMIAERAKSTGCAVAYVNQMSGQDELVFDGGSFVVDPRGVVRHRAAAFEEDILLVEIEGATSHAEPREPWPDDLGGVYRALLLGLGDYVRKNGFRGVVLGMSGGVDSALVATLAVEIGRAHV